MQTRFSGKSQKEDQKGGGEKRKKRGREEDQEEDTKEKKRARNQEEEEEEEEEDRKGKKRAKVKRKIDETNKDRKDLTDLDEEECTALTGDLTKMQAELQQKYPHIKALEPTTANVSDVLESLKQLQHFKSLHKKLDVSVRRFLFIIYNLIPIYPGVDLL